MRLPAYRFKREVPEDIEASRGAAGNGYSKMVDDVTHGTAQDIGLISESLRSRKKHLKQFLKASK